MDIEKVKNYNQKMLAVFVSLGIVLLLVVITILIIEALPGGGGHHDTPPGLIAGQKVETLNQNNLRKQVISYETPWLIDTVKSVYVVPVSIKTLKKPEEVASGENNSLRLFDVTSSKMESDNYTWRSFDGQYTNLLLYSPKMGSTISLFSERVMVGQVRAYYFKDDILLVFYIASKDTDENGVIDLHDLRGLGIYSLNTGVMRRISDGDNRIEDYVFLKDSKDMLLEFKLGQYKENQFDGYQSPGKIMRYGFDSQQLADIVSSQIQTDMQKLVEGK